MLTLMLTETKLWENAVRCVLGSWYTTCNPCINYSGTSTQLTAKNLNGQMCHGASKGRWWSIGAAFGDILRNLETIIQRMKWMIEEVPEVKKSTTYKPIFKETEEWLRSPKAVSDITFILGFCKAIWNVEMKFA